MASWDDDDFELPSSGAPAATVKDAWEGEDEEQELPAWDADEDTKPSLDNEGDTEKGPKKKTLQDKIREREMRQRELQAKKAEAERIYTEAEKRQMQEESDLVIAKESLGAASELLGNGLLEKFDPQNLDDFVEFRFHLCNKLLSYKDSPHFFLFAEGLVREVASSLNSDDTRKLSQMLQTMCNEKVKREKDLQGKKKKKSTKPQGKKVGDAITEQNGFEVEGEFQDDDLDDFM